MRLDRDGASRHVQHRVARVRLHPVMQSIGWGTERETSQNLPAPKVITFADQVGRHNPLQTAKIAGGGHATDQIGQRKPDGRKPGGSVDPTAEFKRRSETLPSPQ